MGSLLIEDFSGGLNTRDSPNQVALNECINAENFTLDERGALTWRDGNTNLVALPGTTLTKADIFYSQALDLWLCVRASSGAKKLFTRPGDLTGSWTDRGTIAASVNARAAFADWPGGTAYCIIVTDVADATNGGLYTLDATPTLTKRFVTAAVAIAVWQNKVWIVTTGAGFQARIYFSPPGDPTTWTGFVDFREKDASPLTALGVVGGALIAFKQNSAYRINDSGTGAYSMIDSANGCVNPRTVVALRGRLYAISRSGLYECDGVGPLKNVGDKIRPAYPVATPANLCAGVSRDHVLLGNLAAGIGEHQEFDPHVGWIVPHSFSGHAISSFANKDNVPYAAFDTHDALYSLFTSGPGEESDGTVMAGLWRTPWFLPNSGMLTRLQRLRVQGKMDNGTAATVNIKVYRDWDLSVSQSFAIASALAGLQDQRAAELQSLGHAASVAFDISTGLTDGGSLSIRALQLIDTPAQWPNPGYPKKQSGYGSHTSGRPPTPAPIPNQRRSPPPPPEQ